MSSARLTMAAVLMLAVGSGCASNSADWFGVDLDRAVRAEGDAGSLEPDSIPSVEPFARDGLPDLAAGGDVELSVEQAVLLAVVRNRGLRVAELGPVVTGAFELIERGAFAPEVFANARFDREEAVEAARSTGTEFAVDGRDTTLGAGVRQTLPLGTEVELSIEQQRRASNRAPEQQDAVVGVSITQSLLRGFGPSVNLAAIRQAELETEISRFELRGFAEALVADTEIAYWESVLAERTIEIVERSLEIARDQSNEIDQRIEVGVLAQTESAVARSEVARREQALVSARAGLEEARLRLYRLLDAPIASVPGSSLVTTSGPSIVDEELDDLAVRLSLAERFRPELNEARLRLEQNRLEVVRTRNGLLPRLDLFVAFGKTGFADTFSDSFRELDGPTYELSVGVEFSQSLGESVARGRDRLAIATRRESLEAIRNLQQIAEFDVRLAANEARRTRDLIAASRTTRELQERTLDAERERFEAGASTGLLVAQVQRDLLQAEIAEAAALTNYRIALIRLYLAEGTLLERRGISAGN